MSTLLLDERSAPSLRQVFGATLARATHADFAVTRIRLAGIDLSAAELTRVRMLRVLVGQLDVETLTQGGEPGRKQPQHDVLLRLFDSGRLEVRAAGLQAWYPDFSVLRGLAGGGAVAILGAHYFARPHPTIGPALTCIVTDPETTVAATTRFEELWGAAYDVSQVVQNAVQHR